LSVNCPVVILHGSRDDVIPQDMGRELGAAAKAQMVLLEGSGHGSNLETANGRAAVESILARVEGGQ
jgi:pimeloyl-ACP methyl ester carboxylesterase